MTVILELAVTESGSGVSLTDADKIAAVAVDSGVGAIRLLDRVGDAATIDPTVVGAYLAGRHGDLGFLIDARTTGNAPFNLARRVSSFDRATDGLVGLILRPGDGDEVSDATVPNPSASDQADRWAEYATIVTSLWESFPSAALVGDQERAVVVEDSLIRSIDHDGQFYRVAGPLDGPSTPHGRPLLVAADPELLGLQRVATHADAVIVDEAHVADASLSVELQAIGRVRADVAVLLRMDNIDDYRRYRSTDEVNGVVLATEGRDSTAVIELVRSVEPGRIGRTLRDTLGLRDHTEATV